MKKFLTVLLACMCLITCTVMSACDEKETVSIKYYANASDMLPALKQGAIEVGVVPEPAASKLENVLAADKTWYRLDLQQLYDSETNAYPQAVVMVKQSLLNTYAELSDNLQQAVTANVDWTKNNVSAAVNAINSKLPEGLTPSLSAGAINGTVIDNCKISWQGAADAKSSVKKYIDDIIAVGGELDIPPAVKINDDFFADGTETGTFINDTIKVYAPDGAPALAIAKLIYDGNDFGTGKTMQYNVVDASTIGSFISNGTADIIIMPVTAASKLYKKYASDTYKMAAVVTHGNLYIMSTKQLTLNGLLNKTVGVIGQGQVPDLTFRAVLKARSLQYSIAV